jgi:nucleoside-diphosphate-sugar epimerase
VNKWLVTGGAGFIGSHLVDELTSMNDEVVVYDDFSTGLRSNLETSMPRVVEADLRDLPALERAMKGCTHVVHLGALGSVPRSITDPISTNAVNIDGTLNVLVAARNVGVERVVYASSSSIYGNTPTLPKHESMPFAPRSPYALSKVAGEEYGRIFSEVYGMSVVALRFFNVFGPRQRPDSQYAAVIPRWIDSLMEGERPTIYGDGTQTRDFTFVKNNVAAISLAATADPQKVRGRAFNIACGSRYSLLDLLTYLSEALSVAIDPEFAESRPGDVHDSCAAIDAAEKAFGYRPSIDFATGIAETVEWFRMHASLRK